MNKEKQIQIPESLFCQLCKYFLLEETDTQLKTQLKKNIEKGLENKLEAITRHNLYTQYKIAPTQEEQEQARKEYINSVGIPTDFRW